MEQIRQRKIVFLVYKAGWWGCFDSLYRKLSQDKSNQCFVVPIPYYERRVNDKSIDYSRKHYEADQLPKDVPVTDYNQFSLEEQLPDIIYIHNPYDGQSSRDTIEPKFYSHELKKYTASLIYIPHMLYLDGVPEQLRSSVVYQHVDKIIVANRVVANAFQNVPKEKLEIAGSPLVDYIEKLSETKPCIPKEWKSQLPNSRDFDAIRVILYHVGFYDLYYGTDRAIAKIEYVLNYMKTRADVIFVWKPEYEIEARIEELPKVVATKYQYLKQKFIDEKIGIMDTTEDEAITAIIADAYMGKHHPIMNLFGLQGKPIYFLDNECKYLPNDDELCSVSFLDFFIDEDKIWFVADEYNLLCTMDLTTGVTEVIDEIPNEKFPQTVNYCGIIKQKNKIYLNPYSSDFFMVYDVDNKQFTATYLPEALEINFDYIIPYKEYLFLKAKNYPAIVRYNTKTKEMSYFSDWVKELEQHVLPDDLNQPFFVWGVEKQNNKLMLASSKANLVMEFDMETCIHTLYEVGPLGSKYFGMVNAGKYFWLIPCYGNNLICWNQPEKKWVIFDGFSDRLEFDRIPFRSILKMGQKLVLFPYQADFVAKIDIEDQQVELIGPDLYCPMGSYKSKYYEKSKTVFNNVKLWKSEIAIAEAMYDCSILIIDFSKKSEIRYPCRILLETAKKSNYKWIERDRAVSRFPCIISTSYSLRTIIDYCSDSEQLINYYEKKIFNMKLKGLI